MSNRSTIEFYIQLLTAGASLPQPARIGLISLLNTLLAMLPPTIALIQGGITPPNVGSGFPHLVERPKRNGALSAEDERCELQQYKTKMTRITVELEDGQGAPPPSSCPMRTAWSPPKAASDQRLTSASHAPCLWQASLSWEARCRRAAWSSS